MPNDFTRFPRFTFSSIDRKPRGPLDPSSFIEGASLCDINGPDEERERKPSCRFGYLKRSCRQSNLAMPVSSGGQGLCALLCLSLRDVHFMPPDSASACSAQAPTPWANSLLELEHSSRQVALTGIGENGHNGLALVLGTLRELTRSPHGSTR